MFLQNENREVDRFRRSVKKKKREDQQIKARQAIYEKHIVEACSRNHFCVEKQ
jgi:hypothetical protein